MAERFTRPYVDAFFAVAGSAGAVDAELGPLDSVAAALAASPDLAKLLGNPGVERGRRKALLDAVAHKVGVSPLGGRLLDVLLQNRRAHRLGAFLAAIRERLDRERRILEARVTSARPLEEAVFEALRRMVESRTGSTVRVVPAVDPSLLGGFVVSVGSARLDASLARRLERARAALHALAPAS
ncbi:MAG: ATP synthase F1 subunit delta [Thermoanaerobaculia bacterium]|jgi:F-type H+-transporting ATPase subunit delta